MQHGKQKKWIRYSASIFLYHPVETDIYCRNVFNKNTVVTGMKWIRTFLLAG